jgi:hypothetical protein
MSKSYTELERSFSRKAEGRMPEKPSNVHPALQQVARDSLGQPADHADSSQDSAESPQTSQARQPLDPNSAEFRAVYESAAKDYQANGGKLSDTSYKALEDAGYPRQVVDAWVAGQVAQQDAAAIQHRIASEVYTRQVHDHVGGFEQYDNMQAWAKANMSHEDLAAIDQALQSGNLAIARQAMDAVSARYVRANGTSGTLLVPINVGMGDVDGSMITTAAEVVSAMRDPKYATSESYRAEVQRRIQMGVRVKGSIAGLGLIVNGNRVHPQS